MSEGDLVINTSYAGESVIHSATNNSLDETVYTGSIPTLRFPYKLWNIVNEGNSKSIRWNKTGQTIILNYEGIQQEFLNNRNSCFKTTNITSFVRQLNLYGFKKVNSHTQSETAGAYQSIENSGKPCSVHEFLHDYFKAGRLDLLANVCRKTKSKKITKTSNKSTPIKIKHIVNTPLTKLRICQMALTKALEQATRQFRKEKYISQPSKEYILRDSVKLNSDTIDEMQNLKMEPIVQNLVELIENNQNCPKNHNSLMIQYRLIMQ